MSDVNKKPESFWQTFHYHNFRWDQVAKAYWSRYPNPNSEHVFTEDFVEVRLNEDNSLYTKRLLMKTNSLPWWGKHLFSATRVPMVEEALLYSDKRILITYTRNIGLRKFMGVTERVTFTDDLVTNRTKVDKEVWIDSEIVGLRSAIRKFGIDRFKRNCVSATNGFDCVINRMFGQTSNPLASKKQDSTTQTPGHQRTSGFRGQQLRQ